MGARGAGAVAAGMRRSTGSAEAASKKALGTPSRHCSCPNKHAELQNEPSRYVFALCTLVQTCIRVLNYHTTRGEI
jgi:hypothetical protein